MIDQLVGQIVADKYRIEKFVRVSGNGVLFRGRHTVIDRHVLIKVLSPELSGDERAMQAFAEEARAAARLSDPNVLNVLDVGTEREGVSYIVYEDFDGIALKDMIRRDGQIPVATAITVAKQTAFALAAAHSGGVLHRNLNPENVIVQESPDGHVLVKVFEFAGEAPRGLPEYLSPEELVGSTLVDGRSNIYSLGVILFEMLSGVVPFSGTSFDEIIQKHLDEEPPPVSAARPDLPAGLPAVVSRALAKDRTARYATAEEFALDLERIEAAPLAAPAVNNIWKTAFIVLAGISILAAVLIYGTSVKRTDPATQLQTDANGLPVQPINPATGVQEQSLVNMAGMSAEMIANSNMALPDSMPGGDGYNPWATGAPPPGGPPTYIGPGGQVITIDPNNPSQFMPMDGGVVLVPVPANTNSAVKPTPSPRQPAANANVQATPEAKPTPAAKPTAEKPAPAQQKPAAKPSPDEGEGN